MEFLASSPDCIGVFGENYSRIAYEKLGCERSRFDSIFISLSSEFKNVGELREGEALVQRNIDEFVHAYARVR